jgi:hypothetical protein
MGERRGAYRVLVGRPEGSRPLGRPRHKWEDNIKMDLKKWDGWSWTGLIWFRIGTVVGCCECSNERPSFIKCGELCHWLRTC